LILLKKSVSRADTRLYTRLSGDQLGGCFRTFQQSSCWWIGP